jgi:hypothetical protein
LSKPFRSDKRKKELQRLKKQEEKRLRRFGLKQEGEAVEGEVLEGEVLEGENEVTETGNNNPEIALSNVPSNDAQSETKQTTE